MTNLNIRSVYDHYVKESHPQMQQGFTAKGLISESFSTICSIMAHSLVLLACIPLLAIRRLPAPLDQFPVVGFYQSQWLDELEYIEAPLLRVSYAAARVIDGGRLMINYNPLTQLICKANAGKSVCSEHCNGQCNGSCTGRHTDNII